MQIEGSLRILVVEDEPDLADLYQTWLSAEYDVRAAYSGEEALESMSDAIDVVLLDRRMPGLSGDEVLREINDRGYDCQVVLVTAVDPDFDIIELGFDGYINKPASEAELYDAVDRAHKRATYDERLRELFSLQKAKATLEQEKSSLELDRSDKYTQLEARIESINRTLDGILTDFDTDEFAAAIERTRTVAAHREGEQRYRSLTEDVLDTARVGTIILDSDLEVVWANEQVEQYFGLDRETDLDGNYREIIDEHYNDVFTEDDTVARIRSTCADNASVAEFECRVTGIDGGDDRWLEHWSKPIETGFYAGGRIEHYYDITDQKTRARRLESLHEETRRLTRLETKDEIAEATVAIARDVLGFACVRSYMWDDSTGDLHLAASTAGFEEAVDERQAVIDGSGPLWQAFVEREEVVRSDGVDAEGSPLSAFDWVVAFPVGPHGVVAVAGQATGSFDQVDIGFARLLGANAEAALDRAEREQRLRDRDQELEKRNEQLQRLERVNTIIREIDQALVSADSTNAIERTVCDLLSQVDSYAFVWIGEFNLVDGVITPQARAGSEHGYIDELTTAAEAGSQQVDVGLATRVLETCETQYVADLADNPALESWQKAALNGGYRSVLSVPIVYEESAYAALEVYADQPKAFGEDEREVLSELGETIGHAINAIKRRRALVADHRTELELRVESPGDILFRMASSIGCSIDIQTFLPQPDDRWLIFFSVDAAAADAVRTFGDQSAGVSDVSRVQAESDSVQFKCTARQPELVTTVTEQGAQIQRVSVAGSEGSVTVQVPGSQSVRSFVAALESVYADIELVARRRQPQSDQNAGPVRERLTETLTDRQFEVLQVAYRAGYFDWPRENDGADLAEMLDIAQPTFLQHLRSGEQKLMSALIDE
jgi:predicted DNA binding protein/DNA-binding response OmpR family regulator/putative methionine-R-sulfoxide reductase with GAF domain